MKFLIVDDEPTSRKLVVSLLEATAQCDEAQNGAEAVERFRSSLSEGAPYDLIMLDIVMPEMDGHETARKIRLLEKDMGISPLQRVKIVMLTALNSPQDAMESLSSVQSSGYIVKPVSRETLLGIIGKLGLGAAASLRSI